MILSVSHHLLFKMTGAIPALQGRTQSEPIAVNATVWIKKNKKRENKEAKDRKNKNKNEI